MVKLQWHVDKFMGGGGGGWGGECFVLQGLIKLTLKLTGRHLGLSFQKLPFWLFDRRRNAESRYNVGPFKRKYMLNEKRDFAYHTLYLQRFLASEK